MKVREIYNSRLADLIGYNITLYPFIFFLGEPTASVRVHELVHVWQIKKLGWFRFYFSYLYQYFGFLIRYRDSYLAYRAIEFEVEAYNIQEKYEKLYGPFYDPQLVVEMLRGA